MGKKERDRGARGERLLIEFLGKCGITAKRGFVWMKQSDLIGIEGIHVECKFVESLSVRAAMEQAINEAEKRKDGMPTVFWKKSRRPWLTIMRTEDWAKLYLMARRTNVTERESTEASADT